MSTAVRFEHGTLSLGGEAMPIGDVRWDGDDIARPPRGRPLNRTLTWTTHLSAGAAREIWALFAPETVRAIQRRGGRLAAARMRARRNGGRA